MTTTVDRSSGSELGSSVLQLTCAACYGRHDGGWGPEVPQGWTHCASTRAGKIGCHRTFRGSQHHCNRCHRTFSSLSSVDKHDAADGGCRDPETFARRDGSLVFACRVDDGGTVWTLAGPSGALSHWVREP